ncbi:MAG: hypothetical protein KDA24_03725 [Deltaproteobacteria bacterium]|nr:hypothetical protein [Deltaproteobacteria bacterium]
MNARGTTIGGALLGSLLLSLLSGCTLDDFNRGFRGTDTQRIEYFEQLEPSTADVLWVIDTSCSMEDEQAALAANFPSFIEFFVERQLAFNLAVTSTNIGEEDSQGLDGVMVGEPKVITEADPEPGQLFVDRALMGIDDNHSDEKGLTAAYEAIEVLGGTVNSGFLRSSAHLAVIVVSDEPDYSEREQSAGEDVVEWEEFADWMNELKGPTGQRMADLSVIVGVSPDGFDDPEGCNQPEGGGGGPAGGDGADRGDGYLEAALATGGTIGSICEEDWGDLLGRVGLRAAGLLDAFELTEVPHLETLTVRVNTNTVWDWEYYEVDNTIRFTKLDTLPRPGDRIEIEYHVPAQPLDGQTE